MLDLFVKVYKLPASILYDSGGCTGNEEQSSGADDGRCHAVLSKQLLCGIALNRAVSRLYGRISKKHGVNAVSQTVEKGQL